MRIRLTPHQCERWKALDELGGRCVRCGITDKRCLEIEHKDGDGYLEVGRISGGPGSNARGMTASTIRKKRLSGELLVRFQAMCANCHAIKSFEKGEKRARGDSSRFDVWDCRRVVAPHADVAGDDIAAPTSLKTC